MNGWKESKADADRFTDEIKSILGRVFIAEAPPLIDQHEATDLLVLNMRPIRVGCRVRAFDYWRKYGGEFTIRTDRPSGNETELAKVIDGFVDFLFYGFANESNNRLHAAVILDARVLTAQLARHGLMKEGHLRWTRHKNHDGSGSFWSFDPSSFPAKIVKHRHGPAWAP